MKKLTIIILASLVLTTIINGQNKTCYLIGKTIDRDSKTIILVKQTEDQRYRGVNIQIDKSGNFRYQLSFPAVEAYELIFKDEFEKGYWRPIVFFPDNDTIYFTLHQAEKGDNNLILGSELSTENRKYGQQYKTLFGNHLDYWYQKEDSLRKIEVVKSDHAKNASDSINSIIEKYFQWKFDFIVNNQSVFAYSLLIKTLNYESNKYPLDTLTKYCDLFQQKFPNHPYNSISQNLLTGLVNFKIGGNYIDFTAKDSKGESIILSQFISGNKLTLIDLWAPWCGSCIGKSRKVVPIYKEYKDLGFNVIGVVGGIKSEKEFNEAVKKNKYTWTLLLEINNENKIWEKYNLSYSGGSQFLVNKEGKILAINPTPDELRKFITEL